MSTFDLKNQHPAYIEMSPKWEKMNDCYAGEDRVKEQGTTYLPATLGMLRKGGQPGKGLAESPQPNTEGYVAYQAYKARARFPDYVSDAVDKITGIMHREAANIEVPDALKSMLEKASASGESMAGLHRSINFWQLRTGRLGLLTDVPDATPVSVVRPFIALYAGSSIPNWKDASRHDGERRAELVVLNESGPEMDDSLQWRTQERYRVLATGDAATLLGGSELNPSLYHVGKSQDLQDPQALTWVTPQAGEPLKYIPFVFVNADDLAIDPHDPPLLGLANDCLGMYRLSADFRQALYHQGQATLAATGVSEEDEIEVGAGALIRIGNPEGKVDYVGAPADGLSVMRETLEADASRAEQKSASLMGAKTGQAESGLALQIRQAGAVSSVVQIARAGAEGLAQALRYAAEFVGASPDEVKVEPSLKFAQDKASIDEIVRLFEVAQSRAVLSWESYHDFLHRQGVTQMSYEDEVERIAEEEDDRPSGGAGSDIDPLRGVA